MPLGQKNTDDNINLMKNEINAHRLKKNNNCWKTTLFCRQ
jgi:hypothetical protein